MAAYNKKIVVIVSLILSTLGAGNSFAKEEIIYIPTGLRKVIFSVKFGKKKGPKGPIIIRDIESNQKFSFEGSLSGHEECKPKPIVPQLDPYFSKITGINYFTGNCSFLNNFMNSFSKNYWEFLLDENLGKNKYLGVDPITNKKYEFSLPFSLDKERVTELVFDGGADRYLDPKSVEFAKLKSPEYSFTIRKMKESWESYLKQYKEQQVLKKLNDLEDKLGQKPSDYKVMVNLRFEKPEGGKEEYYYLYLEKEHYKTKEWKKLNGLILKAVQYSKAFKDGGIHYERLTNYNGVGNHYLYGLNTHFLFPEDNIKYASILFPRPDGFEINLVGNSDSDLMVTIKKWILEKEKAKKKK